MTKELLDELREDVNVLGGVMVEDVKESVLRAVGDLARVS